MKGIKKLWFGLCILALLSPIGLMASGTAWGEWGAEEFSKMLGYVPQGLARFSDLWKAPLPDYGVPGIGEVTGYVLSAFLGITLILIITWGIGKVLANRAEQ